MATPSINLDNCAREQIQIPGLIKPHGYLLASNYDFLITHHSENCVQLFGDKDLTKLTAQQLLGDQLVASLTSFFQVNSNEKYFIEPLNVLGGFSCLVHRTSTGFIFEIEKSDIDEGRSTRLLKSINRILAVISESVELRQLLNQFSEVLRDFLSIDRVMVYKFDSEWNGQVIAESKNETLEPFLNLHYPASDIPEQARLLYTRNWLRIIPDVNYTPVRILPDCGAFSDAPLDLSDSVLRSVSPIHIQYLKNMGVGATLVMSIVIEGKLWGLVACHHYSPIYIQMEVGYLCEMFAKIISVNIQRLLQLKYNSDLHKLERNLSAINLNILKQWKIQNALLHTDPTIMDLIRCDGVAVYYNETIETKGNTPPESFLRDLTVWLEVNRKEDIFFSSCLQHDWPEHTIPASAAGVVALRLGKDPNDFIIWFRSEMMEQINWAGDPNNKVLIDPDTLQLSPRRSFAAFKQLVKGKSTKWEESEIAGIRRLRVHILEFLAFEKIRLETLVNEKTRQLAEALQTVEEAKIVVEENLKIKSHMLSSMSHEIRTPLNGILGIAHAIKSMVDSSEVKGYVDLISQSGKRLLATLTSVLELAELEANKKSIKVESCDLTSISREAINILTPLAESKKLALEFHADRQSLECLGDANLISQILYNIIGNAIKYTFHGSIQVTLSEESLKDTPYASVIVEDTGIGMSSEFLEKIFTPFSQESMGISRKFEGVGLGLSLTKKYIDILGGIIQIESEKNKGSRFVVMFPKQK